MRDAILGCMGRQPEKLEELPRERSSEQTYVFDRRGLRVDGKGDQSIKRSPRRQGSKPHVKQGVLKSKQVYCQGHLQKGQGQNHRKGNLQSKQRNGRSQQRQPAQNRYRSHSKGQGGSNCYRNYESGRCSSRHCKFYEKQYERDLLKRNAERLPLLVYTYKQGRPLRGILKKPQFVRTPRMDELVFVEVGITRMITHHNKLVCVISVFA